jgi:hypothetical protein
LILLFPFLFMYFDYDTFSPFLLGGPHFIMFFLLYSGSLMLAYTLYRYLDNKGVAQIASANFPEDITPFQLASFLYGRDRAFEQNPLIPALAQSKTAATTLTKSCRRNGWTRKSFPTRC